MKEEKKRGDCDKTRSRGKELILRNKIKAGKIQENQNTKKMYRKADKKLEIRRMKEQKPEPEIKHGKWRKKSRKPGLNKIGEDIKCKMLH